MVDGFWVLFVVFALVVIVVYFFEFFDVWHGAYDWHAVWCGASV